MAKYSILLQASYDNVVLVTKTLVRLHLNKDLCVKKKYN